MDNKRGQVTIFIIIAIVLFGIILALFFYVKPNFTTSSSSQPVLDKCIADELQKAIVILSSTAGLQSPQFTTMYMDKNIPILCYTEENLKPCVVQVPFLQSTFETSLAKAMKPKIQQCYDSAISDLKARGEEVSSGDITSTIEINPDIVNVKINAPTTIGTADSAQSFKTFDVKVPSQIYTILAVANSILQFEVTYGDSDTSTFMYYYPNLNVQKIRRDDSIKIYIITDKKDIKYQFASKSYAWPAGFGSQ